MPATEQAVVSGTTYYKYVNDAIWVFSSIAAMRAFIGPMRPVAADGNAALAVINSFSGDTPTTSLWAWCDTSSTADNGTTIIEPTDQAGTYGRWIRLTAFTP